MCRRDRLAITVIRTMARIMVGAQLSPVQAGLAVATNDKPPLDTSASVRRHLERVHPPRRKCRVLERDDGELDTVKAVLRVDARHLFRHRCGPPRALGR